MSANMGRPISSGRLGPNKGHVLIPMPWNGFHEETTRVVRCCVLFSDAEVDAQNCASVDIR
jgi:hypothetical protein